MSSTIYHKREEAAVTGVASTIATPKAETMNTPLGRWVVRERTKRNMSQRAFARLCGVSRTVIHDIETTSDPRRMPESLPKIAAATNTPLSVLVGMVTGEPILAGESDADTAMIAARAGRLRTERQKRLVLKFIENLLDEDDVGE